MSFNSFSGFGPKKTPSFLKNFLLIVGGASIGIPLFMILFKGFFTIHPQYILGLSVPGIKSGYLFQLITYCLVQLPSGNLDTGFLFSLFFNLYVLWFTISGISDHVGIKKSITFVASSILSVGIFALALMNFMPYVSILSGCSTLIYSLLFGWLMLNPHSEITLFFVVRLQAKYLVTGIAALHLLLSVSDGPSILFWVYLFSMLFGYVYSLLFWDARSPFAFLRPFEEGIDRIKSLFKRKKTATVSDSKIYDFTTGEPLVDDEKFVDDMLSKINNFGQDSLSSREKKRLDKITKKNR
jgi:hypothetical protein